MRKHSISFKVTFCHSLFAFFCFMFVGQGFAAPVIDQSCEPSGPGLNSFWTWQQEITVAEKGELVGISLYFYPNYQGPGGIILELYRGSGWQTGDYVYEATVTSPNTSGWYYIDVSSAHLMFDIGDQFVICSRWDYGQYPPMLGANNLNAYPGGQLYETGIAWSGWDLAFKTYVDFCECDLNEDGKCNILDYQLFIQDWGQTNCGTPPGSGSPPNDCGCDLNQDGKCNILDYQVFIQDWGRTDCPIVP
jgi:hypothetical protein